MKNLTEKYGLKMFYDQFGHTVASNFYDHSEYPMILEFEKAALDLKKCNKNEYTMIELGSNQAYYSCLFKGILGNSSTKTVMVEPVDYGMIRGKHHFAINGFDGVFLDYSVGPYWGENGRHFEGRLPQNSFQKESRTLEQIMEECGIDDLDLLHCDIDESEWIMLDTSRNVFINKKVNYIFLLTHPTASENLHDKCKTFLLECGYNIVAEINNIGSDNFLLFKRIPNKIINNLTGRKVFGKDETEYFQNIISKLSIDSNYTFVFNIGHQPLGKVPNNSIVFSTADEQHNQPISDHLRDEVVLIFKNYFPLETVSDSRTCPLPLGYLMGFKGNSDIPINSRSVDYSFIGTFNNSGRDKMCEQLKAREHDGRSKYCVITNGWGQGLNMDQYSHLMSNTKIALCPSGYVSKESYRIFEAARCGCVLLVDDLPLNLWYYEGFPGIVIKDWSNLSVIEELLNDPNRMEQISHKTIEWYINKISPDGVAKYVQEKIRGLNHA